MLTSLRKLYGNNTSAWQAHLRALLNIGLKAHEQDYNEQFGEIRPANEFPQHAQQTSEQKVTDEIRNFRFMCGTMIWLDIISSITTGKAPVLLHHHSNILASNSHIRCEDIMGCKNFLMIQIGRIAAQHERKALAIKEGRFECAHFKQGAIDIMQEIRQGLAEEDLKDLDLSSPTSSTATTISDPQSLVTRIYARMALVYLHLVAHDFKDLEMLSKARIEAMDLIQTQTPVHLLSALVLPLFIIGTVAPEEDKQYFRDVFSSSLLLNPLMKHRTRLLPILEEIWTRRQSAPWPGLEWKNCLELTPDILLH
jgi:hypothetical protein